MASSRYVVYQNSAQWSECSCMNLIQIPEQIDTDTLAVYNSQNASNNGIEYQLHQNNTEGARARVFKGNQIFEGNIVYESSDQVVIQDENSVYTIKDYDLIQKEKTPENTIKIVRLKKAETGTMEEGSCPLRNAAKEPVYTVYDEQGNLSTTEDVGPYTITGMFRGLYWYPSYQVVIKGNTLKEISGWANINNTTDSVLLLDSLAVVPGKTSGDFSNDIPRPFYNQESFESAQPRILSSQSLMSSSQGSMSSKSSMEDVGEETVFSEGYQKYELNAPCQLPPGVTKLPWFKDNQSKDFRKFYQVTINPSGYVSKGNKTKFVYSVISDQYYPKGKLVVMEEASGCNNLDARSFIGETTLEETQSGKRLNIELGSPNDFFSDYRVSYSKEKRSDVLGEEEQSPATTSHNNNSEEQMVDVYQVKVSLLNQTDKNALVVIRFPVGSRFFLSDPPVSRVESNFAEWVVEVPPVKGSRTESTKEFVFDILLDSQ